MMGTREQVAAAVTSSNLAMVLDRFCHADVLTAMGWAGKRNPLGVSVLRDGVSRSHKVAAEEAIRATERVWRARNMPRKESDAIMKGVAAVAVQYWLDPTCHGCAGTRFETIPGTPHLSDVPCPKCRGTGNRRYPKLGGQDMDKDPWRSAINFVVTHLHTQADYAEQEVKRLLRTRH